MFTSYCIYKFEQINNATWLCSLNMATLRNRHYVKGEKLFAILQRTLNAKQPCTEVLRRLYFILH